MSDASATNGDSQPQPLYGMPMNSYSGQIQPLSSLLGRSTPLNTVGPSELLHRPFGLLCQTVRGRPRTTAILAWQIGDLDVVKPSELLPRPSGLYADHPAFPAGQSRAAPGLPRGVPIMANTTSQFEFTTRQTGYTYAEPVVAHHAPNYYTP
jgi:hypothetical protein